MRAVQIADLSGPESALKEVDLPEPEPSHPLTPGSGVVIDVHTAGVSFPEVLQTRGEYQIKPRPPVRARQRGGRHRSQRARGLRAERGRPRGRLLHLGRWAEVAVAPDFLTFGLPASSTTPRARADPQLPHRLLLAAMRGRLPRARRCSSTARPAGSAPRRSRWRRASAPGRSRSSRATTRSGSRARRAPTRWSAPTARGRTRPRSCPAAASTSSSTRSAATASPTASGRWARTAGSSSSASPAARSPR